MTRGACGPAVYISAAGVVAAPAGAVKAAVHVVQVLAARRQLPEVGQGLRRARRRRLKGRRLTALTPRVSQAIRAEHGLSIEMIEKDFHVASRDGPPWSPSTRGVLGFLLGRCCAPRCQSSRSSRSSAASPASEAAPAIARRCRTRTTSKGRGRGRQGRARPLDCATSTRARALSVR